VAKLLSGDLRRCFLEQGIAYPIRVLTAAQADAYRQQCDRLEAEMGGKPRTVEVRQMHLHFAWAYRLATEVRVLDAVEDLLGENLVIWATELFTKHAGDRAVSIGWHRDGPYMGLNPERTVTAWIALSPSNLENGCMRFAREEDRKRHPDWTPRDSHTSGKGSHARNPPDAETSPVVLEPGEMSLHDVFVLHGSDPNQGGAKRVGFAVRFTTPEARPAVDRPPAILVRGKDRHDYFDLRPPPASDEQDALVQMRQSARRHLDATLRNLQHARR
jgi:non-haem Fe2+, alpha-ketoglutarate-dependent halogenase